MRPYLTLRALCDHQSSNVRAWSVCWFFASPVVTLGQGLLACSFASRVIAVLAARPGAHARQPDAYAGTVVA